VAVAAVVAVVVTDMVGLRGGATGPLPASHLGYERARRHSTPPQKKSEDTLTPDHHRGDKALLVTSDPTPPRRQGPARHERSDRIGEPTAPP
jgi:hypothetical protein